MAKTYPDSSRGSFQLDHAIPVRTSGFPSFNPANPLAAPSVRNMSSMSGVDAGYRDEALWTAIDDGILSYCVQIVPYPHIIILKARIHPLYFNLFLILFSGHV